jgi:hypothetical protein
VAQLPSPPLLWRYGCCRGRMTEVMSRQGMVPVPLLTVHGHVHHVDGASTIVGGPRGSPSCLRVPRAPQERRKCAAGGSGAFDDTAGARARWRDVARYAYHARGLSTRLGRDRVCRSHLERRTCCQCFLGPLRWASLTNVQSAVFYPLLGTLSILVPDSPLLN